jgi:hypothetical protein
LINGPGKKRLEIGEDSVCSYGRILAKRPDKLIHVAPELCWDEIAERPFAEWLLNLVTEAAEKREAVVFAKPQVWEGTKESFASLSQCAGRLKSLTKPFLNWAGKAERQQISVPTLPLFVHERHSTQAILETLKAHKARGTNLDLFGDAELDIADKLDAYQHKGLWTNRLTLGDSLQVMNSLLEYEGMGGQVQMRERLQELDPAPGDLSLYRTRQLVPPHRMEDLRRGEVMIANWHRLAKKETNSQRGLRESRQDGRADGSG